MSARVADVMTTDAVAVHATTPFKRIAASLREQRVSALPVIDDDGKVIGVVSEADLLPKEALEAGYEGHPGRLSRSRHAAELDKAKAVTTAEVMSRPPVTIGPYDLVSHAAHVMYDRGIRCLPVVHDGRLVGVISRADALSVFGRSDEEVRREVIDKVIRREFGADPAAFTVSVTDGVVTLEGGPRSAGLTHDVASVIRHLEGVVAVRERAVTRRAG